MTSRTDLTPHRAMHLRKEPSLNAHISILLRAAHERQERERAHSLQRAGLAPSQSLRHQLGGWLIRLGRRLSPEPSHEPAWSR
jgi:hypothetical protein